MAKCYKVEVYVLALNGDFQNKEILTEVLENYRYIEHLHVQDIQETDVGEWHDDHELNKRGANYQKFFPDSFPGPCDLYMYEEYRRVRSVMLQQISRNTTLERENRELIKQIQKLKKVQDFLQTIGDLTE